MTKSILPMQEVIFFKVNKRHIAGFSSPHNFNMIRQLRGAKDQWPQRHFQKKYYPLF